MGLYDEDEEDDLLDTDIARSPKTNGFLNNLSLEDDGTGNGSVILEEVTGMSEEQFKENLGAEMAKGEASDLPETSMGAISLLKSEKEGSQPYASREEFDADLSGRSGEIKAAKAKLYGALESGGDLTSSQTLALGVLALGLITAGAAAKGKRGIAAGAEAFNTGGQLFLKQKGASDRENQKTILSKIGDLEKEEGQIRTQQMKNDTAGFEREERIGEKIATGQRMKAAGLGEKGTTVNFNVPGKLSDAESQKFAAAESTINEGQRLAAKLKTLPSDGVWDRARWQTYSSATATPEGKLMAEVQAYAKKIVKAENPGNPSEWEGKSTLKTLTGDFTASPADLAELLGNRSRVLAASTATDMESSKRLREDYQGQIDRYKTLAGDTKPDLQFYKNITSDPENSSTSGVKPGDVINRGAYTIKIR